MRATLDNGLDADDLRELLRFIAHDGGYPAGLLYCQPTFQNPTGTVLAPERRRQVLDVARASGAFVIEDDFARRLGHGGAMPRPLVADDGTVVHVTSLTKPAARVRRHSRPRRADRGCTSAGSRACGTRPRAGVRRRAGIGPCKPSRSGSVPA